LCLRKLDNRHSGGTGSFVLFNRQANGHNLSYVEAANANPVDERAINAQRPGNPGRAGGWLDIALQCGIRVSYGCERDGGGRELIYLKFVDHNI
jgi:hypothetical protein